MRGFTERRRAHIMDGLQDRINAIVARIQAEKEAEKQYRLNRKKLKTGKHE